MGEVEVLEKDDARRRFPRQGPKHAMGSYPEMTFAVRNWKAQKSYETMNDRYKKKVIVHSYVKLPVQATKDWGEHWGCWSVVLLWLVEAFFFHEWSTNYLRNL